jgi:hypothetical protein
MQTQRAVKIFRKLLGKRIAGGVKLVLGSVRNVQLLLLAAQMRQQMMTQFLQSR